MSKRKDIPQYAIDQNGIMKKVLPIQFSGDKIHFSEWHYCCYRLQKQIYRIQNSLKVLQYAKKYRQQNQQKIKYFSKNYYQKNKQLCKQKTKRYNQQNPQKVKQSSKKSKKKHLQKNREKVTLRLRKKRQTDPIFKFKNCIRCNLKDSFRNGGYKKSYKSQKLLGCTLLQFKKFIQNKFKVWMTWQNYGKSGWVFDHIVPLAICSVLETDQQQIECIRILCHYSNYQPLGHIENSSKKDNYEPYFEQGNH